MISVEERVAYLVGRVEGQSDMMDDIRDALRGFEGRMDQRFEVVDRRFEAVDRKFEVIDRKFEAIDRKFELVDRRFDSLDGKMSRQFLWLVGLSVTTLATMAAGFAALAATLAGR